MITPEKVLRLIEKNGHEKELKSCQTVEMMIDKIHNLFPESRFWGCQQMNWLISQFNIKHETDRHELQQF